jgi:hypothetical protein
MKTLLVSAVLGLVLSATAEAPKSLAQHPVWKLYLGSWKAEGELKGKDGNTVTLVETWKGTAQGEHGFLIEGERILNGDKQSFQWRISENPATQTFEALLVGQDAQQQIRFEANVSDVNFTVELKAVTGAGSNAITVSESFPTEDRKTMESQITFTNEQGDETLGGTVIHQKQADS